MPSAISRILIPSDVSLITLPKLAEKVGRNEALFLQQLHYWLTAKKDMGCTFEEKKWIYNTYEEWREQIKIFSLSTIRRIVKKLEGLEIIFTKMLGKKRSDRTKWYTINYEALSRVISLPHEKSHVFKMNGPCVQNEQIINKETETTSENKSISSEATVFVKLEKSSQQVNFVKKKIKLENNLALKLLEVWNQTVGQGSPTAQLTKKRAQHLVAAFKFRFESNLEKWKQFCHQISTSDFLMGKVHATFKASLDWVLKFDTIQRILEGNFGIRPQREITSHQSKEDLGKIKAEIDSTGETVEAKNLRQKILHKLGVTLYQSWFKDLSIHIDQDGRGLHLHTKSLFVRDWIQTNYLDNIRHLSSHVIQISCA